MQNFYDLLKTVAILLVVIGHVTILYGSSIYPQLQPSVVLSEITTIIYSFHMPLFMAISGSIFQLGREKGKYEEFIYFFTSKTKRLIVPYMFIGTVILIPTIKILGYTNSSYHTCLTDFLLSRGDCIYHLWYLPALFWIFMIAFLICKVGKLDTRKSKLIVLIVSIILPCLYNIIVGKNVNDIFGLYQAFWYLPYFFMGMFLNREQNRRCLFASVTLLVLFIGVLKYQSIHFVDAISLRVYPCCLIFIIYYIARNSFPRVQQFKCNTPLLLKYSYPIYLFHLPVIYISYATMGGGNFGLCTNTYGYLP